MSEAVGTLVLKAALLGAAASPLASDLKRFFAPRHDTHSESSPGAVAEIAWDAPVILLGTRAFFEDSPLACLLIVHLLSSLDLMKYLSCILSMPVHTIPLVWFSNTAGTTGSCLKRSIESRRPLLIAAKGPGQSHWSLSRRVSPPGYGRPDSNVRSLFLI